MNYRTDNLYGIDVIAHPAAPVEALPPVCLEAAEEGAVLLKNDGTLPFAEGERISVFGAAALSYIRSGTGSGGRVNPPYQTDIPSSLRELREINEELLQTYRTWKSGMTAADMEVWDKIPWCVPEMPLSEDMVAEAAAKSDAALMVIGRYAGEWRDNSNEPGSYLLSPEEEVMMDLVCKHFKKTAVLLNVGNIIDMYWVDKYKPGAVLYAFQGGQEGGRACARLLCGLANPAGKLTDTIAGSITDYPSDKYYHEEAHSFYGEDIYVGYRYFETFAPQAVKYPFGYGLSYTTFKVSLECVYEADGQITVSMKVENTGGVPGKEVIQVYYGAPQGRLGKPAKALCAFAKTELLEPGMSEIILLTFDVDSMASFDDSGVTGEKNCYLLEEGDYVIYAGTDVRSAQAVYTHNEPALRVVSRHEELLSPVKAFDRLHPVAVGGGYAESYEPTPLRTYDLHERIKSELPAEIPQTGDRGIKLYDVADGKATLEEFIAQLSDVQLTRLCKGEGMNSPKVTGGTGCAYGGLSDNLTDMGIPAVCGTDGPSGIRMEGGGHSTCIPCGTLLACSWNTELVETLHALLGIETFVYKIDTLLSPGINIHRHPLNGRNFEYYSEDPLLTGKMAAAACRGMESCGTTMTVKHFIANSRETNRYNLDAIVSARALREIYAKGFEIAVKEGGARAIMTSYNPVNGIWSASNYDLNTKLLREEWGYEGFVMTDWWACVNDDGDPCDGERLSLMVRAQNDIFMVRPDASTEDDDLLTALAAGDITRGQLQRCVGNILRYILRTSALVRESRGENRRLLGLAEKADTLTLIGEKCDPVNDEEFDIRVDEAATVLVQIELSCTATALSQLSVSLIRNNVSELTVVTTDTRGERVTFSREITLPAGELKLKLRFGEAIKVERIIFKV